MAKAMEPAERLDFVRQIHVVRLAHVAVFAGRRGYAMADPKHSGLTPQIVPIRISVLFDSSVLFTPHSAED